MSQRHRIAFATCDAQPNLFEEEHQLLDRAQSRGFEAHAVSWTSPAAVWSSFDRVILRSTWDYFQRAGDFAAWLDAIESQRVSLLNPVRLVRWNMTKTYLADLAKRGVATVPTAS